MRSAAIAAHDLGLTGQDQIHTAAHRILFHQQLAVLEPAITIPERLLGQLPPVDNALVDVVRARLEALGPVLAEDIAASMGWPQSEVEQALYALENEGFVLRGHFTPDQSELEWCERRLLARIHRYTLQKLRKEIEPVSSADFMRFLFAWHGLDTDDRPEGTEALRDVLGRLEGFQAPAAAWEGDILPARTSDYDYRWLDALCLSGGVVWGRFRRSSGDAAEKTTAGPIKSTPISLIDRENLESWRTLSAMDEEAVEGLSHPSREVLRVLGTHGALFFEEIASGTGLLRTQVEEAVRELVSLGAVTSDGYTGLRALLVRSRFRSGNPRRKRRIPFEIDQAGRWTLLRRVVADGDGALDPAAVDTIARALLRRYGVVFRRLAYRENLAPGWRDLVRVLRKLEARGEIRGGRFVDGVWGEQFALPGAVAKLRSIRKAPREGKLISITAADPLNLTGVIGPGRRVPALYGNRILYRDGVAVAVKDGKELKFLGDFEDRRKWDMQNMLVRRNVSPRLRSYLGRGIG